MPRLTVAIAACTVAIPFVLPAQREPFAVPAWAFPFAAPLSPAPRPDSVLLHSVPGSSVRFTMKQVQNGFDIPDWFPRQHAPMPPSVQYGVRPDGRACGYCHLPDGQGRPENGTLAGLPVEYAVRQVRAFRDGTRVSASPVAATGPMHTVAKGVTDEQVREAAVYYVRIRPTRRNVIREVRQVPTTRIAGLLYAYDGNDTEPIAGRLIEVPETLERHDLRDPWVPYITYVPEGSIARGKRLAMRGPTGAATACTTCHGPRLLGVGDVPPIAGRSPSNMLRQLINFRTRARRDSTALPMYAVSDAMSIDDMVAVSAYVGSLVPAARRSPTR